MGFNVTNLAAIKARMRADGVKVVPLASSVTGRLQAMTVLDPNGIRIQLYEYVEVGRSDIE